VRCVEHKNASPINCSILATQDSRSKHAYTYLLDRILRGGSVGARVERACGESATVTTQYTHNHLVTSARCMTRRILEAQRENLTAPEIASWVSVWTLSPAAFGLFDDGN
jgi:hypothetical protein